MTLSVVTGNNKIKKISNLNPLSQLLELYLQTNKIKQIENLPKSLVKLDLSNNELENLNGISQAEELNWLSVENNLINNIQELNSLKKLTEFYCAGNYLNDIKGCYNLREVKALEIIDISSNEVCRTTHDIRLGMIYYCKKLKNFNRINIDESERAKAVEYFTGKLTSEVLEKRFREMAFLTKGLRISIEDLREETPKKSDFCFEGGLNSSGRDSSKMSSKRNHNTCSSIHDENWTRNSTKEWMYDAYYRGKFGPGSQSNGRRHSSCRCSSKNPCNEAFNRYG